MVNTNVVAPKAKAKLGPKAKAKLGPKAKAKLGPKSKAKHQPKGDKKKRTHKPRLGKKTWTATERMLQGLTSGGHGRYWKHVKVRHHPERGRTLVARKKFESGDFVLEYEGDVIDAAEGARREEIYTANGEGCYIVDAWWRGRKICCDATRTFNAPARLLNHARRGNLKMFRPLAVKLNSPRFAMFAARRIAKGDELFWDYGIKRKETPWASFRCPKTPMFAESDTPRLQDDYEEQQRPTLGLYRANPTSCVFDLESPFCPHCGAILLLPAEPVRLVCCHLCHCTVDCGEQDVEVVRTKISFPKGTVTCL